MNDTVVLIEILAQALREQPEAFDPDFVRQHLDRDRLAEYLRPRIAEMLASDGTAATAPGDAVDREIQTLMDDPEELHAILGGDLRSFLDIQGAAQDAHSRGIVPPDGYLEYAIQLLDDPVVEA